MLSTITVWITFPVVPVTEASCRWLVSWVSWVSMLFCVSIDATNTAATSSIEIKANARTLLSMPPITRFLIFFNNNHLTSAPSMLRIVFGASIITDSAGRYPTAG